MVINLQLRVINALTRSTRCVREAAVTKKLHFITNFSLALHLLHKNSCWIVREIVSLKLLRVILHDAIILKARREKKRFRRDGNLSRAKNIFFP